MSRHELPFGGGGRPPLARPCPRCGRVIGMSYGRTSRRGTRTLPGASAWRSGKPRRGVWSDDCRGMHRRTTAHPRRANGAPAAGYRRESKDENAEILVWKLDDLMQRYDVYGERAK